MPGLVLTLSLFTPPIFKDPPPKKKEEHSSVVEVSDFWDYCTLSKTISLSWRPNLLVSIMAGASMGVRQKKG